MKEISNKQPQHHSPSSAYYLDCVGRFTFPEEKMSIREIIGWGVIILGCMVLFDAIRKSGP